MYFFIDPSISQHNSGVEHAVFNRIKLFDKNGKTAKLVTRNYNRTLHRILEDEGLKAFQSVSMFDFFQESEKFERKPFRFDDLKVPNEYELNRTSNYTRVYDGDLLVMEVTYFPKTFEEVSTVQFYDGFGNTVETDFYDWRGFKSMEQYSDDEGQVSAEFMYTPEGKRVYESYYQKNKDGNRTNSLLKLPDYKGLSYNFNNLGELFTFFLDELNTREGGENVFISDRRINDSDQAMLRMKTKSRKFAFIHSTISESIHEQVTSSLNGVYEDILVKHKDEMEAIIVSTSQEKEDIIARFPNLKDKLFDIPAGIIPDEQLKKPRVKMDKRVANRIVSVGRISKEKNPQDIVKAFNIVQKSIPEATLEFRGYTNGDEGKQVSELVEKLQLKDKIIFNNYSAKPEELDKSFNEAQVSVLASDTEGFAMVLVEAQAHGLPQVAYDISYGPSQVIQDGENGYLVRHGDYNAMAEKLVSLLKYNDLDQMSEAAFKNAANYSQKAIWQKWSQVVD